MPQNTFAAGTSPRTTSGELTAPPRPLAGSFRVSAPTIWILERGKEGGKERGGEKKGGEGKVVPRKQKILATAPHHLSILGNKNRLKCAYCAIGRMLYVKVY